MQKERRQKVDREREELEVENEKNESKYKILTTDHEE